MPIFWKEFEKENKQQIRRIVLMALPYPLFLLVIATVGSIMLVRTYPMPSLGATLQQDIWVLTGLVIGIVTVLLHVVPPWKYQWNWYRYFAFVQESLNNGDNLPSALHQGISLCPFPLNSSIRDIERTLQQGLSIAATLHQHACPRQLCEAFRDGRSEPDLAQILQAEIRRFMNRTQYQIDQLRRLSPALAMGCAGAGLFWFIFRIILPVLTSLMQWEMI